MSRLTESGLPRSDWRSRPRVYAHNNTHAHFYAQLLKLSAPHQVLSARLEELFDLQFQIAGPPFEDDQGPTANGRPASATKRWPRAGRSSFLGGPGLRGDQSPGNLDADEEAPKKEDRYRRASLEKDVKHPERGSQYSLFAHQREHSRGPYEKSVASSSMAGANASSAFNVELDKDRPLLPPLEATTLMRARSHQRNRARNSTQTHDPNMARLQLLKAQAHGATLEAEGSNKNAPPLAQRNFKAQRPPYLQKLSGSLNAKARSSKLLSGSDLNLAPRKATRQEPTGGLLQGAREAEEMSDLPMSNFQKKKLQRESQIPSYRPSRLITKANYELLTGFFEFLAQASCRDADKYLHSCLRKALHVLQTYPVVSSSQWADDRELRAKVFGKVYSSIGRALENGNLSRAFRSQILQFLVDDDNPQSFLNLLRAVVDDQVNLESQHGVVNVQVVVSSLDLLDLLPRDVKQELLDQIFSKLTVEIKQKAHADVGGAALPPKKLDILRLFKLPNRQVIILILTQLIQRKDFKGLINRSRPRPDRLAYADLAVKVKRTAASPAYKEPAANLRKEARLTISNTQIRDIMGLCLKAVGHFLDGQKSFETLTIYLKLAFKIFVCVGVEGSQSILGGRTMQEFIIYFLMKSLEMEKPRLDKEKLALFMHLVIDSLSFILQQIQHEEKHSAFSEHPTLSIQEMLYDQQLLSEIMDALALFSLQFRNQNKHLFEILKGQIDPLKASDKLYQAESAQKDLAATKTIQHAETKNLAGEELPDLAQFASFNRYGHERKKIDYNKLYRVIHDLDLNPIILASLQKITAMDFECIEHIKAKRHDIFFETQKPDGLGESQMTQMGEHAQKSYAHTIQSSFQMQCVSLKFFSNLVRNFNEMSFDMQDSSSSAQAPYEHQNKEFLNQTSFLKMFQIVLNLCKSMMRLVKRLIPKDKSQSEEFFATQLQVMKNNLQIIQVKVFHSIQSIPAKLSSANGSQTSTIETVLQIYFDFVLQDVAQFSISLYQTHEDQSRKFNDIVHSFIIEPLTKILKRVQYLQLFAPCSRVLVSAMKKLHGTVFQNDYKSQYKVFITILQIWAFQLSDSLQNSLKDDLGDEVYNQADTKQSEHCCMILESLYDIMKLMGAPQCFEKPPGLAVENLVDHDHKNNSTEVIHLWAQVLAFLQKGRERGQDHLQDIRPSLNQIASLSPCILYDQDFNIKIKGCSHMLRDVEGLILNNYQLDKYPQLEQSLKQLDTIKKEDNPETKVGESPSKTEMIRKVEEAKVIKLISIKLKNEEVDEEAGANKAQAQQQEDLFDDQEEEVDVNLAKQLLSNNEITFIAIFILLSESRLNYFRDIVASGRVCKDSQHQNFLESLLITFNSLVVDQDNLQQKLEQIAKVLITDYIQKIRQNSLYSPKSVDISAIVRNDIQVLLKARLHLHSKVAYIASWAFWRYIEQFPLILLDFQIFRTMHDVMEALSENLSSEYVAFSRPVTLKTLDQVVIPPSDHSRLQKVLRQLVARYGDLFVYAYLVDKDKLEQHFEKYQEILEAKDINFNKFGIQMHMKLRQSFTVSKFEQTSKLNILEIRSLLILEPKSVIDEVIQFEQLHGKNAFFQSSVLEDVFQLGSLPAIKDQEQSLGKISPFTIFVPREDSKEASQASIEEPGEYMKSYNSMTQRLHQDYKLRIESTDRQRQMIHFCDKLLALLLKYVEKIDITAQLQYLQKHLSLDKILRELTKEQLLIKEQQISAKIDMMPWRTKHVESVEAESPSRVADPGSPTRQTQQSDQQRTARFTRSSRPEETQYGSQNDQTIEYQISMQRHHDFMEELQSRLELTQFLVKVLQTINKEAFIRKQSKKIKAVLSALFNVLKRESLCSLYKQKVVKAAMGSLATVLEPSVVQVVDEIVQQNTKQDMEQFNVYIIESLDFSVSTMTRRFEFKKSLKSHSKVVRQSYLPNALKDKVHEVQQLNSAHDFFSNLYQYDTRDASFKYGLKQTFKSQSAEDRPSDQDEAWRQQSPAFLTLMDTLKLSSSFNQQWLSTRLLRFFDAQLQQIFNLFHHSRLALASYQAQHKLIEVMQKLVSGFTPIILSLAHKRDFFRVAMSAVRASLIVCFLKKKSDSMNRRLNQVGGNARGPSRIRKLARAAFDLLQGIVQKQKKILLRCPTVARLKECLQLIEDVKHLLHKVNVNGDGSAAFFTLSNNQSLNMYQFPQGFATEASLKKGTRLFAISRGGYRAMGVKNKFVKVRKTYEDFLVLSVQGKYLDYLMPNQEISGFELGGQAALLNNIFVDALNHLKYGLLGCNFQWKLMMDIPYLKQIPLVSVQTLKDKSELFILTKPKLLKEILYQQSADCFKQVFISYLKMQMPRAQWSPIKFLERLFWKSETVLEIIMKQVTEDKSLLSTFQYRKLLTNWRNTCFSRMIAFLGYKFSGNHFIHKIALKPFYASSSKVTIFYLSQCFQSLRWDTDLQIQKFLVRKSQQLPSLAHNVIWFCRVEQKRIEGPEPHRKVPLPVEECLDQEAIKLEQLILKKMTDVEKNYFAIETEFLEKITQISGVLQPSQSKDEKKAIIREKLIQYNSEIPERFYLPTNQGCRVVGIVTSSGQPMQSAARVPILISFQVQDYEGPDLDPLLNKGKKVIESVDQNQIAPVKQHGKLSEILQNLTQCLLQMNQLSIDQSLASSKLLHELKLSLYHQQLQNYQDISESLLEMLNTEFLEHQHWLNDVRFELANSTDTHNRMGNFDALKQPYSLDVYGGYRYKANPTSIRDRLALMNNRPTLKIKMSQYLFQTKQNPLQHQPQHSLEDSKQVKDGDAVADGDDVGQHPPQKKPSSSLFARPAKLLGLASREDPRGPDLRKPVKKNAADNRSGSDMNSRSPDLNESFTYSKVGRVSEVSDSESNHDYGGGRRASPFKATTQIKQTSRMRKFKSSQNSSFVLMQPALNVRRLSLSQFFMDSSNKGRKPHHISYRPSIFGGKRKTSANDSMDLSSPYPLNAISSSGMNLVLEFEKHLLQSQQRRHNLQSPANQQTLFRNPPGASQTQEREEGPGTNLGQPTGQDPFGNSQVLRGIGGQVANQGPRKDMNKPIKIVSCIFKVNDDLRQDILAIQFIKLFQKIFKKCDLDLFVAPYKCISNRTGSEQLLGGIIEVVPNSNSRDQIGKAYEIDLYDYFLKKYGNESSKAFMTARLNFIQSLAAYSVVSYILQIKDRHNGNILIDDQGHLIHIDFGFIFDWSPGRDMRFESANFKMTKEFIKILGGSDKAEPYLLFVQKTIQGYLAVREHHREFMNLVELMIYSGFPCFKQISLQTLQQRFRMEGLMACSNQFEAAVHMQGVIQDAHDKWSTTAYDMIQYRQNKIVY